MAQGSGRRSAACNGAPPEGRFTCVSQICHIGTAGPTSTGYPALYLALSSDVPHITSGVEP
jgi:hypothetical protein